MMALSRAIIELGANLETQSATSTLANGFRNSTGGIMVSQSPACKMDLTAYQVSFRNQES